jgi:hypothetical protein
MSTKCNSFNKMVGVPDLCLPVLRQLCETSLPYGLDMDLDLDAEI